MRSPPEYDVIIAGGGLTGASLALALAGAGRIALIEVVPPASDRQPSYDDRGLALALSSQRVLDGLGVWESITNQATPVKHIHVSDQHHFGSVRLHAEDLRLPALGYVITARALGLALIHKVRA
ncbi:MAG: FAD-dependent monooxygenase, partial [Nevskiales bacterium]